MSLSLSVTLLSDYRPEYYHANENLPSFLLNYLFVQIIIITFAMYFVMHCQEMETKEAVQPSPYWNTADGTPLTSLYNMYVQKETAKR